jgi:hypothetical protein
MTNVTDSRLVCLQYLSAGQDDPLSLHSSSADHSASWNSSNIMTLQLLGSACGSPSQARGIYQLLLLLLLLLESLQDCTSN